MESLFFTRPLVFWSNVVLLPLLAMNLLCACAVLFSMRLMRDPCILAALLIVSYYLLISGGPGASGEIPPPRNANHLYPGGVQHFSSRGHAASGHCDSYVSPASGPCERWDFLAKILSVSRRAKI